MRTQLENPNPITCVQPSVFKRVYELRQNDLVQSTIRYAAWPPNSATMECGLGTWQFRRVRWYRSDIGIWQPGFELPFAQYVRTGWGLKGVLELPMGERLEYDHQLFKGIYSFSNSMQQPVVKFSVRKTLHDRGDLIVLPEGEATIQRQPWIPAFLFYLIAAQQQGSH